MTVRACLLLEELSPGAAAQLLLPCIGSPPPSCRETALRQLRPGHWQAGPPRRVSHGLRDVACGAAHHGAPPRSRQLSGAIISFFENKIGCICDENAANRMRFSSQPRIAQTNSIKPQSTQSSQRIATSNEIAAGNFARRSTSLHFAFSTFLGDLCGLCGKFFQSRLTAAPARPLRTPSHPNHFPLQWHFAP